MSFCKCSIEPVATKILNEGASPKLGGLRGLFDRKYFDCSAWCQQGRCRQDGARRMYARVPSDENAV